MGREVSQVGLRSKPARPGRYYVGLNGRLGAGRFGLVARVFGRLGAGRFGLGVWRLVSGLVSPRDGTP